MKMKTVVKYEAFGKQFDSKTSARQHEVTEETVESLRKLLNASIRTGRPEAVLREMLEESSEISRLLQSFRKKYPKDAAVASKDTVQALANEPNSKLAA
jgi:hypothetical protein